MKARNLQRHSCFWTVIVHWEMTKQTAITLEKGFFFKKKMMPVGLEPVKQRYDIYTWNCCQLLESWKHTSALFSYFCLFSLLNFCSGSDAQGRRQMVPLQPEPPGAPKTSPGCDGDRGCSSGIPELAGIASLGMPNNSPWPRGHSSTSHHGMCPETAPASPKRRSHPPWGVFIGMMHKIRYLY